MKRVLLACAAFALVAASPAEETRHTVKDGETLNGIANRAGVPASAIIKANGLKPPYPVRVGQVLEIPRSENAKPKPKPASVATSPAPAAGSATHVVKDGETLNGIANRAGVSATALADANKLKPPYALRTGQKLIVPGKSGQKPAKPAPSSAPAPASSGPATDDGEVYVVKDGETFNGIANRTGIPRSVLAQANGLTAPYVVKSGQKLVIPRQKVHVVANGETGFGISFKYGVPYEDILTANGLPKDSVLKPGQKLVIPALVDSKLPATAPAASAPAPAAPTVAPEDSGFRWPLTGKVITRFDPQAPGTGHRGIDIEAALGQVVVATKAGKVIYAAEEPIRYGKMVVIEHEGQWYSAYAHLSSIGVTKGETVKAGEIVGYAGSTGEATRPQLHFELRQANKPVDPLTKLP